MRLKAVHQEKTIKILNSFYKSSIVGLVFCFCVHSLSAQIYLNSPNFYIAEGAQIYVGTANTDEKIIFSFPTDKNDQSPTDKNDQSPTDKNDRLVDAEQINESSTLIFVDSCAKFFISENALYCISESRSTAQVVQKKTKSSAKVKDSVNIEKPEKPEEPEKQISKFEEIQFSAVPQENNGNTFFTNNTAVTAPANPPQTRFYAVTLQNENIFPILTAISVAVTEIEKKSTIDFSFSLFSRPPPSV
jgi:hypothetical protein